MVINQINQILVQNKLVEADQFCKVTQRQIVFLAAKNKEISQLPQTSKGCRAKRDNIWECLHN